MLEDVFKNELMSNKYRTYTTIAVVKNDTDIHRLSLQGHLLVMLVFFVVVIFFRLR
jgi:hypothetical protein